MQANFSDLEYAAKMRITRRDRFLSEIDAVTPQSALVAETEPFYPEGDVRGRTHISVQRMLRMCIAQQRFGLSDESIETAIHDSEAIRIFIGIDLNRETPLRCDDTAQVPPPPGIKQTDRTHLHRHQFPSGGQDSGMTHTLCITAANVSDIAQAHALLHGDESATFGDAGYQGVEKCQESQSRAVKWHVALRHGKSRVLPDTETKRLLEHLEKLKTSVRAKV
jgi:IS5 family transposase